MMLSKPSGPYTGSARALRESSPDPANGRNTRRWHDTKGCPLKKHRPLPVSFSAKKLGENQNYRFFTALFLPFLDHSRRYREQIPNPSKGRTASSDARKAKRHGPEGRIRNKRRIKRARSINDQSGGPVCFQGNGRQPWRLWRLSPYLLSRLRRKRQN